MQPDSELMIGEVAALTGLPSKTIRYYEESGIIESARRNDNRYRTYSQVDVQTLRFVAHARSLGFSLKDVGELLSLYRDRNRASKDVRRLAGPIHRKYGCLLWLGAHGLVGTPVRSAYDAVGRCLDVDAALEERVGLGVRGSAPSVRSAA